MKNNSRNSNIIAARIELAHERCMKDFGGPHYRANANKRADSLLRLIARTELHEADREYLVECVKLDVRP